MLWVRDYLERGGQVRTDRQVYSADAVIRGNTVIPYLLAAIQSRLIGEYQQSLRVENP